MRTYGFGVDPTDLRLKFCEGYEQYYIEVPGIVHRACVPALCLIRSSGEISSYNTQRLELVCLA